RDDLVTGVQTCALPIFARGGAVHRGRDTRDGGGWLGSGAGARAREGAGADYERGVHGHEGNAAQAPGNGARWLEARGEDRRPPRSEERRGGKGGSARWA